MINHHQALVSPSRSPGRVLWLAGQAEPHLPGPAPSYVLGASIHPPISTSQTLSATRTHPPTPPAAAATALCDLRRVQCTPLHQMYSAVLSRVQWMDGSGWRGWGADNVKGNFLTKWICAHVVLSLHLTFKMCSNELGLCISSMNDICEHFMSRWSHTRCVLALIFLILFVDVLHMYLLTECFQEVCVFKAKIKSCFLSGSHMALLRLRNSHNSGELKSH